LKNVAYISLGSNIGDKMKNLLNAIDYLKSDNKIIIHKISSVYITEPKYYAKQDDFYNLVLRLYTELEPLKLLFFTQSIEKKMGRKKTLNKNRPRIIDVDILCYNNIKLNLKNLLLPHPLIKERKFILEPFNEISPNFCLPESKKTINELLNALKDSLKVVKL
tara:strand:- start:1003 stop:1491 length:489 start_codon:yes stop_codon:yes gene_type:complete